MSIAKELSKKQIYHSDEKIVSPYVAAKAEWDDRIGSSRVQAYNWRLFALISISLNIILSFGMIYQSTKSSVIPYVVKVNSEGIAEAIGPAKQSNYIPQQAEIKYFLAQFVQKIRTVPLDPVVSKQNWISAYGFLGQSAAQKMNDLVKQDNPVNKLGKITTQIEINVIVPISKDTYQIRWQEKVFDKSGVPLESYKMTGIFSIFLSTPTTEKELLSNPLGIYIKDLSYNKEL